MVGEDRGKILERVIRKLRKSVDGIKEYEITEDEEETAVTVDREFASYVLDTQYQEAQKLKQKLLKRYNGKTLEDVVNGEEIRTEKGPCYCIRSEDKVNLKIFDSSKARSEIISNLKLIHGIGEITERALKEQGYKTIEDLTEHPRFGDEAIKFLETLDRCDTANILNWIERWFPKSHPLVLHVAGLYDREDFLFLDIETMGLFNRPIILVGVANITDDKIAISQYFLRDIPEEPGALAGLVPHTKGNGALVTFNGKSFDVPYIKERLAYYRMRAELDKPNFDIYHFSRRAWREKVPNCRLTTLEKHLLGMERENDVPSALVPEFYETYLETKNPGPVIPIIEHNKQDLITLANIFSKLCEEWDR